MKVIFDCDELTGITRVILEVKRPRDLREVLIGFWLFLPEIDRKLLIMELEHYQNPGIFPPSLSDTIAKALYDAQARSPSVKEKPLT